MQPHLEASGILRHNHNHLILDQGICQKSLILTFKEDLKITFAWNEIGDLY